MPDLPDSETLYHHFLSRWIPPEDPRTPALRSDLEQIELDPGRHIRVLSPLTDEGRLEIEKQIGRTTDAAMQDLPALLDLQGEPDPSWLDAIEAHLTPERLQNLLRSSNPDKPDNPYLVFCCETGAVIARVLQNQWSQLRWLGDFPYWESSLFDLNAKLMIPVFHWALKTMSGDERKPLRDKVAATVEFLQHPEE